MKKDCDGYSAKEIEEILEELSGGKNEFTVPDDEIYLDWFEYGLWSYLEKPYSKWKMKSGYTLVRK